MLDFNSQVEQSFLPIKAVGGVVPTRLLSKAHVVFIYATIIYVCTIHSPNIACAIAEIRCATGSLHSLTSISYYGPSEVDFNNDHIFRIYHELLLQAYHRDRTRYVDNLYMLIMRINGKSSDTYRTWGHYRGEALQIRRRGSGDSCGGCGGLGLLDSRRLCHKVQNFPLNMLWFHNTSIRFFSYFKTFGSSGISVIASL